MSDGARVGGLGPLAPGATRIAARLIDAAVVLTVFSALRSVVDNGLTETPSAATSLATLAFAFGYEVGMVATRGGTLGKLVLGLRVTDETNTTPPSVRTSVMRWLPNVVAAVPFVGPIIALAFVLASLIWIFTDGERRSIFDKTATTHVVRVR